MEKTAELVLDVFLGKSWDPNREVLARVALGLLKVRREALLYRYP